IGVFLLLFLSSCLRFHVAPSSYIYTLSLHDALPISDHTITVLNLAGINVVDLFTVVLLAGPFGRAVVLDRLLGTRAPLTNGQGRSEERRVGKECRARCWAHVGKKAQIAADEGDWSTI